jgi:hypothetical protein
MSERKTKHEAQGQVDIECEETSFILEPKPIEVGAGYTVSVSFDEHEKPIVNVKTYGQVDITKLKREISKIFPNAHICKLDEPSTLTVVRKNKKKPKNKRK